MTIKKAMLAVAERKFHDGQIVTSDVNFVSDAGVIQSIPHIGTGSTVNHRVGNKITGTSIEFRLLIHPPVPSVTHIAPLFTCHMVRIIIFIWKDDTVPVPANILESFDAGNSFISLTSPLDHDLKVKRKVLFDKVFLNNAIQGNTITPTASNLTFTDKPTTYYRKYIPLQKYGPLATVHYSDNSESSNRVNGIYILAISNYDIDGDDIYAKWIVNWKFRYNFVDL